MSREPTATPEEPKGPTMEQVLHPIAWEMALQAVEQNRGAAGPDAMSAAQLKGYGHLVPTDLEAIKR